MSIAIADDEQVGQCVEGPRLETRDVEDALQPCINCIGMYAQGLRSLQDIHVDTRVGTQGCDQGSASLVVCVVEFIGPGRQHAAKIFRREVQQQALQGDLGELHNALTNACQLECGRCFSQGC